jgi:hypothetical protein
MTRSNSLRLAAVLAAALVPVGAGGALAQDAPTITAEGPILVTSAGQALDAFTVRTLLTRAGVELDYDPTFDPAGLDAYNTVIVAVGASLKGFGAAGITTDGELARGQALIHAAEAADKTLIVVHIGGVDRRDALSQQFIELMAPAADYLVVWRDGNADGYFTEVAEAGDIPFVEIPMPLEIGNLLAPALTN